MEKIWEFRNAIRISEGSMGYTNHHKGNKRSVTSTFSVNGGAEQCAFKLFRIPQIQSFIKLHADTVLSKDSIFGGMIARNSEG